MSFPKLFISFSQADIFKYAHKMYNKKDINIFTSFKIKIT